MKPIEYMSKQELLELNKGYLLGYCIESLGYDEDALDDYTHANLVSIVLEDNKSKRKLAKLNPSN